MLNRRPLYKTNLGKAYVGDSVRLMKEIPSNSIDLIVTSPPFALKTEKPYGNVGAESYVEWIVPFAQEFHRILRDTGSLVLHVGGSWRKGEPAKEIYNYRLLIYLCDYVGFFLAQDFFWFNTAKLPGPAQWVTVEKIRVKDAVDVIWWLSKTVTLSSI